jgi:uncharacterized protein YggT (Ycf19 family)
LLWLNWRSRGLTSLPSAPGIALIGTLKRAGRRRVERWPSSVALVVILAARAILYAEVGSSTRWTPSLSFGPIALHFRTDDFGRMQLFSFLSFALFLAGSYFSLFLIAAVNGSAPKNEPWTALIRAHLGVFGRMPAWMLLLAPFFSTFVFWIALCPVFETLQLMVATKSFSRVAEQALVIGLSAWTLWQYAVAVVLMLYIVSSYVYLGRAPFWNFIALTARNLLRPLSVLPLRLGKIDLAPLLGLALVMALGLYAPRGLVWLYSKLAV